jgi:CelD/BcsL family acetyltransferase involved in cellulose biosynthesis
MPTAAAGYSTVLDVTELELTDDRWRNFVQDHPDALAFHRPAWSGMIVDCYGYRPFVLAMLAPDDRVIAGIPVIEVRSIRRRPRWVALPFSDVCPPLLTPGVSLEAFTGALDRARAGAGVSEFDVRAPLAAGRTAHLQAVAVMHTIDLGDDSAALFRRFHKSQVQRNIKRGERDGKVTVRRGETAEDLTHRFYALHLQTRRRHGMPIQPRRFFEAQWRHVLEPGAGHVLLAYADGKPVGGAVFLDGNSTLTYKYGASDDAYWKYRPNHLVLWHAMRAAIADGYAIFDLGRSDLPDQGLREFKSGWAGEEQPLRYTTMSETTPQEDSSGRGMGLARSVLRRSPTWASRVAGELFYRYSA